MTTTAHKLRLVAENCGDPFFEQAAREIELLWKVVEAARIAWKDDGVALHAALKALDEKNAALHPLQK